MNQELDPFEQLRQLLESVAASAQQSLENLFGPVNETTIPPEEVANLLNLVRQNPDISHQDLARLVYDLSQKYRPPQTPDEFTDWFKRRP